MSLYDNTAPVLMHNMTALAAILRKAEKHCEDKKIDKSVMLGLRLAPDMFSLTRQVQLVTDFAKGCAARLSGTAVPSYVDEETTFEGLYARLDKCITFVGSLEKAAFEGAETREVTIKQRGQEIKLAGADYGNNVALPNFYFHMVTAYNILRSNGVELGKGDFIGRS
jgi:uncharacterized protein